MSFDVICDLSSHMRTHISSVKKHPGECNVQLRLKDLVFYFDGCHSLVVFFGFFFGLVLFAFFNFFREVFHCLLSQFSDSKIHQSFL